MRHMSSLFFPMACALALAGCTTAPAGDPAGADAPDAGALTIEGTVASIDTQPWAYDGNAVVRVDVAGRGAVPVELPARWNLCQAGPVDVEALAVGMRVKAVGAPTAEGGLVVCQDPSHRLVPAG